MPASPPATTTSAVESPRAASALGQDSLARAIPRRPRAGRLAGLLLALGFAVLVTPAIVFEITLVERGKVPVAPAETAAITVRVPQFAGHHGSIRVAGGGVLIARGEVYGRDRAAATAEVFSTLPRGNATFITYLLLCAALVAVYSHHLRRDNRGRLLRVQAVNLTILAAVAVATKVALLTSSASVLAVPVALAAIVPTLVLDRTVGLATGVLTAVIVSLLVPFDVGVTTVLVAQAATAGLLLSEKPRRPLRATLLAGLASAFVAAFTYGVFTYLSTGVLPLHELAAPAASGWVAATAGGLLSGALALLLLPLYQVLVGEITSGRLTQLSDLSHPLLRQIAEKSPGTWQHTLAMANMAEVAANAIGASGRLVRVGAYYHDLGKSLQPKYFIENLEPGEPSPHEQLPPEVSCDAIFAHVTEGIVAARRAKLHERVIDFMHMHHGNGVLEYFWAKCQRQGNQRGLSAESFRYPGVPPQSRETAILAIVDAVEAAARTLKKPDPAAIDQLVQRIVYGKLHLGQLDESGLSMADLRRISDCLRESIKHAHHERIEYPWQQAEPAENGQAGRAERADGTAPRVEPPLDSLDTPRPGWRPRPSAPAGPSVSKLAAVGTATFGDPPEDRAVRHTRRGVGPPPAPSGRAPFPLEPSPSDAAVTAPFPAATPSQRLERRIDAELAAAMPAPLAIGPTPGTSLASRIDAQLASLGDEYDESPFAEPVPLSAHEPSAQIISSASRPPPENFTAIDTSPALPSYPDDADVTSQQPLAEVEELVALSLEPSTPAIRRHGETHEVDPDDIEAAIEVAPKPRRHASVVQRLPQRPAPGTGPHKPGK